MGPTSLGGSKFATIEVRFDSEERDKELSIKSFEYENLLLIHTYLGRRVTKKKCAA